MRKKRQQACEARDQGERGRAAGGALDLIDAALFVLVGANSSSALGHRAGKEGN